MKYIDFSLMLSDAEYLVLSKQASAKKMKLTDYIQGLIVEVAGSAVKKVKKQLHGKSDE